MSEARSREFGELVRRERTARGISQGEMARKLDVSQSYLSMVESGQIVVNSINTFLQIAQILKLKSRTLLRLGHPEFRQWKRALATKREKVS